MKRNRQITIKRSTLFTWTAILVIVLVAFGTWQLPKWLSNHYVNEGAKERNYLQAIPYYDRAIQLNSKNDDAYFVRGHTYMALGEDEKALADFNRAIELNPRLSYAYAERAYVYFRMGEAQLALDNYDHAIELDPAAIWYYSRGSVYAELGDYEAALEDLYMALSLPATPEFYTVVRDLIDVINQEQSIE
jgi:tetratricopeptide (TPR) repeat protein